MYELNVRRKSGGACPKCTAATRVQTCERIDAVLWIPLYRTVRWSARCEACGWWDGGRIKNTGHPRTAGSRQLIMLTWALFIGGCLAIIPYKLQRDRTVDGYAVTPVSGDVWRIDREKFGGSSGMTSARVDYVSDREVSISLCDDAYDNDECISFTRKADPVPRGDVVRLLHSDAIDNIERDGDLTTRVKYFGALIGAMLVLFFVHALRSRRVLA